MGTVHVGPYADIAHALHEIANKLADLDPATGGVDLTPLVVRLDIQPQHTSSNEAARTRTVDTVAQALLDSPGQMQQMNSGSWHHTASGPVGPVTVAIYAGVASPAERELEQLRAQRDALLAELGQHAEVPDEHQGTAQHAADAPRRQPPRRPRPDRTG